MPYTGADAYKSNPVVPLIRRTYQAATLDAAGGPNSTLVLTLNVAGLARGLADFNFSNAFGGVYSAQPLLIRLTRDNISEDLYFPLEYPINGTGASVVVAGTIPFAGRYNIATFQVINLTPIALSYRAALSAWSM